MALGGSIMAITLLGTVVLGKDAAPTEVVVPVGTEQQKYDHKPEAVLKADVATAHLLSEADIEKIAFRAEGGQPVRTELVAWGEFLASDSKIKDYQIAEDRKVWIVQTYYPDGYDTKRGRMENALVTGLYDGETGAVLGVLHRSLPTGQTPES